MEKFFFSFKFEYWPDYQEFPSAYLVKKVGNRAEFKTYVNILIKDFELEHYLNFSDVAITQLKNLLEIPNNK